ncbi:MAG TPA: response regulator transcription factor [Anaerolineales bacterium]|nr:response regulator transcription factor [Anaerolineales bacterium]
MKALIADDDLALADVVSFTLRRAGYEVILAHDGAMAVERWQAEQPDFIILDLNMPKLTGLEVCQRIRAEADTPILILSVRDEDDDIVTALKYGADDYIVKPFSPRQLVARVDAVLRRAGNNRPAPEKVTAGGLTLDIGRGELLAEGEPAMRLTPLENKLLQTLMLNRDQVLPAETLIDRVWGPGGADRAMLKQVVYRLRAKVEKAASGAVAIETVPGVGYSLSTAKK